MSINIAEKIEDIEERIESIKWLLIGRVSLDTKDIADISSTIKKSSGILGRSSPKGISYENQIRRTWKTSFTRRISPS